MTATTHPALIAWPAIAAYGRNVPKARIYEHGAANARLKELFVKQVDAIVWQYKLAPETINLPARPDAPEIEIFSLQLKVPELHHEILRCIDRAIPLPLLFELHHAQRVQVVAAYKRPSEACAGRWVASDYFASDWLAEDSLRSAMPVALHLGGLYEQLIQNLIPLVPRQHETLAERIMRIEAIQAKRRELAAAVLKIEKERQFNRKVEINSNLRKLMSELASLEDSQ